MYSNQVPQSIQQTKKQTQMESQQDIVDLTINDDDDCFFLLSSVKWQTH